MSVGNLLPIAYLYSTSEFKEIGTIPSNLANASASAATGANNKGEVVGSSFVVLGRGNTDLTLAALIVRIVKEGTLPGVSAH